MDLKQQRTALDTRKISAEELATSYIEKVEKRDGAINAFIHFEKEKVLSAAKEAQKLIDGNRQAALTGIPIGLKDCFCTVDMPTTCAAKMLKDYVSPYEGTAVLRLRSQGAVFMGKLNLDEFAMGATTAYSHFGATKNPFDLTRTPGGSSGGSAAAVAADMCAAALGSDTGGSIRQPAAFCGVTGLRPTYGMVSRYGVVAFASSLDQVGPIAWSAEDCAVILESIAGTDGIDQTVKVGGFSSKDVSADKVKGMKIGIITELMGGEIDSEVKASVEAAAKIFEKLGATVKEVSLPMIKHSVPVYYLISSAEASSNMSRFDGIRYGYRTSEPLKFDDLISRTRAEAFGWEVKRRIMLGSYALCEGFYDDYYMRAVKMRGLIAEQYKAAFKDFDVLLSPTTPTAAYKFDCMPDDPTKAYVADICTASASIAGIPAVSTTSGYTKDGMPIGIMLTAAKWQDATALSAAAAFEKQFERRRP